MWLVVKFQSSLEIAGSPRNSFRASVVDKYSEGRALKNCGPHPGVPRFIKLRMLLYETAVRLWGISSMVKRETAQTAE